MPEVTDDKEAPEVRRVEPLFSKFITAVVAALIGSGGGFLAQPYVMPQPESPPPPAVLSGAPYSQDLSWRALVDDRQRRTELDIVRLQNAIGRIRDSAESMSRDVAELKIIVRERGRQSGRATGAEPYTDVSFENTKKSMSVKEDEKWPKKKNPLKN